MSELKSLEPFAISYKTDNGNTLGSGCVLNYQFSLTSLHLCERGLDFNAFWVVRYNDLHHC